MFILTHDTLWNPQVLEVRTLPRRFLGRVMPFPRRGAGAGLIARLIFEIQPLRYIVSLVPFVVAMFIWPELAFPLAQAPLAMLLAIAFVEIKLLRLSDKQRAAIIDPAAAARVMDLLRYRSRDILTRIAARHGIERGALQLVVEQSEIARISPLTLVSVQAEAPKPHVMRLGPEDRQDLDGLFDTELGERDLLRVNLRDNEFLRSFGMEARSVSAHARLQARLAARAGQAAAGA